MTSLKPSHYVLVFRSFMMFQRRITYCGVFCVLNEVKYPKFLKLGVLRLIQIQPLAITCSVQPIKLGSSYSHFDILPPSTWTIHILLTYLASMRRATQSSIYAKVSKEMLPQQLVSFTNPVSYFCIYCTTALSFLACPR